MLYFWLLTEFDMVFEGTVQPFSLTSLSTFMSSRRQQQQHSPLAFGHPLFCMLMGMYSSISLDYISSLELEIQLVLAFSTISRYFPMSKLAGISFYSSAAMPKYISTVKT
jgi:hypothetical protein